MEDIDRYDFSGSKNVNLGTNYGHIGDRYSGIKQRTFTEYELNSLIQEIESFSEKYGEKINKNHITIGFAGDKESLILANKVAEGLTKKGYEKIEVMTLITYGVTGKKVGVSNAPDDTILIEIFPSDNV